MNTHIALSRLFALCRVRERVARSVSSSIDSRKQRASFSSNRDEGRTAVVEGADEDHLQKSTVEPVRKKTIRSNDGTSSGAIAADRLRNARRYATKNMIETFPKQQHQQRRVSHVKVGSRPPQPSVLTNEKCDTLNNNGTMLSSMSDEDLIAELARRRCCTVVDSSTNTTFTNQSPTSPIVVGGKEVVREHGLIHMAQTIENPIRSNDGTSSGAIVADRLRQARRKAIENLSTECKPPQTID